MPCTEITTTLLHGFSYQVENENLQIKQQWSMKFKVWKILGKEGSMKFKTQNPDKEHRNIYTMKIFGYTVT